MRVEKSDRVNEEPIKRAGYGSSRLGCLDILVVSAGTFADPAGRRVVNSPPVASVGHGPTAQRRISPRRLVHFHRPFLNKLSSGTFVYLGV